MSNHQFCRLYRREALSELPPDVREQFKRKNYGITYNKIASKRYYFVELVGARPDGANHIFEMKACCAYEAVALAANRYLEARKRGEVR